MSYNNKNLSVMAYANGFTLWSYSSSDAVATIKAANYFNEAAPFVRPGDMILVTANNTAANVEAVILAVAAVSATKVTIAGVAPTSAAA